MIELNLFSNFYNNLSSDGVFFFWIVIFLLVFLIFLLVILVMKNKKLVKILKESSNNIANNEEDSLLITKKPSEDITPVEDGSLNIETNSEVNEIKEEDNNNKIVIKNTSNDNEKEAYKKNILREMNSRMQTSPIHIDKAEEDEYFDKTEEFYYEKDNNSSILEEMEDKFETNSKMEFASNIVKRMEEEIKPSNIELTEYEKKQEEEAIISYEELLKVKDKIYNITEDEETDEFIDELKSFRLDLK